MEVFGSLETHGAGTLRMNDLADQWISVCDSAWFAGGSAVGLLTTGEIDLDGNFRQGGSTAAYAATSPHVSYFESEGPRITFANPGYTGLSHFGDLYFDVPEDSESADDYLMSNVFAAGQLQTGCIVCEISHFLHAGTAGVGITSEGANVNNVQFDGLTWDLKDGYAVNSMQFVDFENQDPTRFSSPSNGPTPFRLPRRCMIGPSAPRRPPACMCR